MKLPSNLLDKALYTNSSRLNFLTLVAWYICRVFLIPVLVPLSTNHKSTNSPMRDFPLTAATCGFKVVESRYNLQLFRSKRRCRDVPKIMIRNWFYRTPVCSPPVPAPPRVSSRDGARYPNAELTAFSSALSQSLQLDQQQFQPMTH